VETRPLRAVANERFGSHLRAFDQGLSFPRMPRRAPTKRKMPAFTKPSEETRQTFEGAVAGLEGAERRTMFGYPSVFLNGNMLACVFQDRIMVRLSENDRAEAISSLGAKQFQPSPGRAMKEYVELPAEILQNASAMRRWLERGRTYVRTLPAKKPKKK